MKGTCVEGTIPRLFEGKMLVSTRVCPPVRMYLYLDFEYYLWIS